MGGLVSFIKKQLKIKSFKHDFYLECGTVVYKVEKSYDLIQEIVWRILDLKISYKHFEFFNIHIWFMPLREYVVSQYDWRPSLKAVNNVVSNWESPLVEHLADPAINLCLECKDFNEALESNTI